MTKRMILIAAAVLLFAVNEVLAQGVGSGLQVERIPARISASTRIWTVKFLCGTIAPSATDPQKPASDTDPLVPGTYRTAINILVDSSSFGIFVDVFEAKPINPLTIPQTPGATGSAGPFLLGSDGALEVDCPLITNLLYPRGRGIIPPAFLKGFARIRRSAAAEVVVVYTSNRTVP